MNANKALRVNGDPMESQEGTNRVDDGVEDDTRSQKNANAKVPMPTYVGSNTQFLSIPMIQFNLRGQGNSCKVEVEPAFCRFQGDTFINHMYKQEITLKKRSEG